MITNQALCFLPVRHLIIGTAIIALVGCGGGGSSSSHGDAPKPAGAPPAVTDSQPAAPLEPWLGSWVRNETVDCQQRLTLYADQSFVWTEAKSVVSGRYELIEAPEALMQLDFLYSNAQSDCSGAPQEWVGAQLVVPYQLSPKETLQWTLQSTAEDGSTTPVDLFWDAIGDQLLVQGDPLVANYRSPFKFAVMSQLERVGFRVEYEYNGGYLYPESKPTLLFKDGTTCKDMSVLVSSLSVTEHRAKYPGLWGRWEDRDDGLYYGDSDGADFSKAAWNSVGEPVASKSELAGSFSRLDGVTMGTLASTWHSRRYEFFADGRFSVSTTTSTGAGTDVSNPAALDVFLSSLPPAERGTYTLEGFHLTLKYDSGHTSHQFLITLGGKADDLIWINGLAFTQ